MGVGVDGEQAPDLQRQVQQAGRRVPTFRAGVDLDGGTGIAAGGEDLLRVELGFGPDAAAAGDEPPGAVPEHIGVRIGHRLDHSPRHRRRIHRQLGVHAGHHHVEALEEFGFLIKRTVLENVDLDAGQDPHRRDRVAQFVDDVELLAQALGRQAVGDFEARRVVRQRAVLVPQFLCREHHFLDRGRPIGPVGVHVQVAA